MLLKYGQFTSSQLYAPADESGGGGGGAPAAVSSEAASIYSAARSRQGGQALKPEGKSAAKPAVEESGESGESEGAAGDDDSAGKGDSGDDDSEDFSSQSGEQGEEGEQGEAGESGESEGESEGEGEDSGKESEPKLFKLDPETIKLIRGEKSEEPSKQQQPSPEQLRKMLNPVEVTDELINNMRSDDPAVVRKAFQDFANATVKNAFSLANLAVAKAQRELQATIEPLASAHQQAQVSQARNAFYTQNKDLQKYDKLVRSVAAEIQPDGPNGPKSQEQIFKEVATGVRKILASYGIKQPAANHGAGEPAGKGVPRPNKQASSGRSGGGSGQGQQQESRDAAIYRGRI